MRFCGTSLPWCCLLIDKGADAKTCIASPTRQEKQAKYGVKEIEGGGDSTRHVGIELGAVSEHSAGAVTAQHTVMM